MDDTDADPDDPVHVHEADRRRAFFVLVQPRFVRQVGELRPFADVVGADVGATAE
jgi:hypothetical protein